MSLSTEQIKRLAELCGFQHSGYYVYMHECPNKRGFNNVAADRVGETEKWSLNPWGERLAIEKLEFSIKHSPTDGVWFVTFYMDRERYVRCNTCDESLSQAIEAAVKAWLEITPP